jgi:tRNA1(Val) A37 N6-methylase TrmN6
MKYQGFDFASLPPSSVIFDVGGGVGTVSRLLANKYEHLKFVIQDRAEVCEEGTLVSS